MNSGTFRNQGSIPVKVMVAKVGLDGHDRGLKVVARGLKEAGMEVVYLGMRLTAEAIAVAAEEEDVDVLGISSLSGTHMRHLPKIVEALEKRGVKNNVLLVVGGTIPDSDVDPLVSIGVDRVFPVGSVIEDIISFIRSKT